MSKVHEGHYVVYGGDQREGERAHTGFCATGKLHQGSWQDILIHNS